MLKNTSILALFLLLGGRVYADPVLNGVWRSDLGNLRLQTRDGRVTGHYESGGRCDYLPGQRVLEAEFEGNVLVGTLSLCQEGAACKEKVYSVLAFYDPNDGVVSAHLRLDAGCTSPALKQDAVLVLTPPEGGTNAASADGNDRGGSASAVARNKKLTRRSLDLAEKHFTEGMRLLESGDYRAAKAEYERGLTYHEDNYAAYNLLGVIQMKLDNAPAALDAFRKSLALNQNDPIVAYNIACAWARMKNRDRSIENLKLAVKYGFGKDAHDASAMSGDPDLSALLRNDPEYKAILNEVWDRRNKSRGH